LNIALIQGHPDPSGGHFCHALADIYGQAAREAGHLVRAVEVAQLDFPILRSAADWRDGKPCDAIRSAQDTIAWAQHLAIVFPLWLGDVPALLKGFFEQALRPGFAIGTAPAGRLWKKLLKGRSARIVVTMGMPAFFYRLYYRSHSVRSLKRNVLEFCGVDPVRTTLIGTVESAQAREMALAKVQGFGAAGR
jgi:putative NADPH-quinone reductase